MELMVEQIYHLTGLVPFKIKKSLHDNRDSRVPVIVKQTQRRGRGWSAGKLDRVGKQGIKEFLIKGRRVHRMSEPDSRLMCSKKTRIRFTFFEKQVHPDSRSGRE